MLREAGRLGACAAAICVVVSGLAPSAALGAIRYAEPGGNGPAASCPVADPCDIQTAVEDGSVLDGDEVAVLPGFYPMGTDELQITRPIHVHGVSPFMTPTLSGRVSITFPSFNTSLPPALSDVRIEGPGIGVAGLSITRSRVERVFVHTVNTPIACAVEIAVVSDSVCWSQASGGAAVTGSTFGGGRLQNVTAVATGPNSSGISLDPPPGTPGYVIAANTIGRGTRSDIVAIGNAADNSPAYVFLGLSNFAVTQEVGDAAEITEPSQSGNQSVPPAFADPQAGDFHQLRGSPTIDAGVIAMGVAPAGNLDLDGQSRVQGAAPDIGADEFAPVRPVGKKCKKKRTRGKKAAKKRCKKKRRTKKT